MIQPAYKFSDYHYTNHYLKIVTFKFNSKKRVKTKVLDFIKNNHQESEIIKYLKQYDLELCKLVTSKKYNHYLIIDKVIEDIKIGSFLESFLRK